MSVQSRQVAVSTSATLLDPTIDQMSRYSLAVTCVSGNLWVGPSAVTSATGLLLTAGQSVSVDLGRNEQLYGISDATGATAHVLQSGGF
jgi:hypothetical protein